jgi:hypothetical protein
MANIVDTNTGESIDYTTKEYKQEEFGGGTDYYTDDDIKIKPQGSTKTETDRGTVMTFPGREPIRARGGVDFAIPGAESSIWDEGFVGTSMEELHRYRTKNQPNYVKALYSVGGGVVSGIGSIERNRPDF